MKGIGADETVLMERIFRIRDPRNLRMLPAGHWNENGCLRSPKGFELRLHVHATQLVYHEFHPLGKVWEALIRMFLDSFRLGADDRDALVNQLRVALHPGVEHMSRYIREGWDMEDNEENMKVLSALLEIKMILHKNPNI